MHKEKGRIIAQERKAWEKRKGSIGGQGERKTE